MKKTNYKETDFYQTTDIAQASALCSLGYQVEAIDKRNPSKAIFLIKRDGQLDDVIQQYFTQQLRVEPNQFFNYLKNLKTRIYNS